ncbi:fimbrial protein [Erwinia sp. HR93]|uniref:fimbrial protein n=1 Tax=Erwinia sp. HR93 TaxID=3094840 RepID=UPI002ADEBF9B|nr:fimbrial protein [Erwinia sp. HR93]MEA1065315.1 fimbrial protein [Erwinia sp. HR93]
MKTMSKYVGALLGIMSFGASAVSSGMLDFSAKITSATCSVDVNGLTHATVDLPNISTSSLTAKGMTAGATSFVINVTQCADVADGALSVVVSKDKAVSGPEIAATGSATNVAFGIRKGNQPQLFNDPAGSQTYPITLSAGKGSVQDLAVYYLATATPVSPGTLSAVMTVTLKYN